MTEAEWLACTDMWPMLWFLRDKASKKASNRHLRLFACACCRTFWPALTDTRSREAVEASEKHADNLIGRRDLEKAAGRASKVFMPWYASRQRLAKSAATVQAVDLEQSTLLIKKELAVILLRDIIGNPFRPPPSLPTAVLAWNDRTIPRLAQAIYDDRQMPEGAMDNSRLTILADALLDAGCEDEALIQHCRQPGPHIRGCWAVDLILGKE
jgi:hypothetical protein